MGGFESLGFWGGSGGFGFGVLEVLSFQFWGLGFHGSAVGPKARGIFVSRGLGG